MHYQRKLINHVIIEIAATYQTYLSTHIKADT
jgi:hypothetical protein